MFPSQHADLGRGAMPETVLNSRENMGSGDRTWVLGCGCTRTSTIDTMAAAMGYGGNVNHLPLMQAAWTKSAETKARERLRIEYRQAHGGVEPPPMGVPAKHDHKTNERLGGANRQNPNYILDGQNTTTNNSTMFIFGNKKMAQKVPGFSGVRNNDSLSFAIAEEGESLEDYAARHGDIPLTTLTTVPLGNARVLGDAASEKYEGIYRSENDENDEPQWAKSDNHDDVVQDTTFISGPAQNSAIFTTAAIHDNTIGKMPPKITFKLKSAITKAREAQEAANKATKNKIPTAGEIRCDVPVAMTEWPDSPATPKGGDEYQENLCAEPRMAEKYRMFGDDIETMRLHLNAPCYNEAEYAGEPGTPETPGKYVDKEWNNRTHFEDLQPTNFYTALPGAPMEWKTKVGVDASGWDVYSDGPPDTDAKFEAICLKAAPALKGKTKVGANPEGRNIYVDTEGADADCRSATAKAMNAKAATQCGMNATETCNQAFCKSKTIAQTPMWSPFSAKTGFAMDNTDSAESRNTVALGWFARLAGVPEGTEIAFDTSAPGFQNADQSVRVATMTMMEDEKAVMKEVDKIAEEMSDDMKASKKRILMLMKEKKEQDLKKAEAERIKVEAEAKKAAEDLRRLEEELAGL